MQPIRPDELVLRYSPSPGRRKLSFAKAGREVTAWRNACREKLRELLGLQGAAYQQVRLLRRQTIGNVRCEAYLLQRDEGLTVPAYLLTPDRPVSKVPIIALHGHGEAEALIEDRDDYHHRFGLELAQAGRVVLVPALRGFGALRDLTAHLLGRRVDYWRWGETMAYTAVTDAVQRGRCLLGQSVDDLLCWDDWLCSQLGTSAADVVGISYGGDLALTFPPFSKRVGRIYASGTLGSFEAVFARCYNAPAHLIPDVVNWMDRSDIAGLNAPRPVLLQYGERDRPSLTNFSAALNETVKPAFAELRAIYRALGNEDSVAMHVSPGLGHEIDLPHLLAWAEDRS